MPLKLLPVNAQYTASLSRAATVVLSATFAGVHPPTLRLNPSTTSVKTGAGEADTLLVGDPVWDDVAVIVAVDEHVPVGVTLTGVSEGVCDKLLVGVTEGEAPRDRVELGEDVNAGVPVEDAVPVGVIDGVDTEVADDVGGLVTDAEMVEVALVAAVPEAVPLVEGDLVPVPDDVALPDRVGAFVCVPLLVRVPIALRVCEGVAEGDAPYDRVADADEVALVLAEEDEDEEGELDELPELDGVLVPDFVGVRVWVGVLVPERVPDAVFVPDGVAVLVLVLAGVALLEEVERGDSDVDLVVEGVLEGEGVPLAEPDPLVDELGDVLPLDEADPLMEADVEALPVPEGVVLRETDMLLDGVFEGVPVRDGVTDDDPV